VTLFMALLAGFKVLLHRATGLTDIVVGTAVAGRDRPEVEGLIGFFVNMLVMRTDLSGSPRFRDVLARVRETVVGAFAHQELPFEKLVEELGDGRDRLPFQIPFGLQNAPAERLELPGVTLGIQEAAEVVPRFDLTVWVLQEAGGLRVSWTYRTDVFTAASVERIHARYERLLLSAVQQPDERIQRLETLTDAERAEREAAERAREKHQVEQLFSIRRRGVSLSGTEAPAGRKGVEG
jgi:non-ribosomal peptide synthetase component F